MNRPLFHRFPLTIVNFFTPRGWRWLGYLTLTGLGLALIACAFP